MTAGSGISRLEVLRLWPDDWRFFRRVRLAALADSPDAFGSRYLDWADAPAERWRARLADVPLNLAVVLDGEPVGMVSGTDPEDGAVELISLWVAPAARGRGVGDTAVHRVQDWARAQGARQVVLSVKITNSPARRLYERCGFRVVGASPDELGEILMAAPLG